ncbi:hypothetical protein [Roseofilum casamattae]|uniref:Uncharacterized protein n=1 Tax=Roseofilum casamattae BLCC-M143 TaxID=3022442 RepID=A0ABT7BU81_9CYAN|nr:hypothetical protein [Roseofilum casamattae]MDJ1182741.1 hypothetical protein [Roseofilum casamattae BLCC-M143]
MLYLARVQKEEEPEAKVQLLANQQAEATWNLAIETEIVAAPLANSFGEGQLVLVTLNSDRQVVDIADAKDWVLKLVKHYLSSGITPEVLQKETEQAEKWRQSLTLQSQEVASNRLQLEARQAQLEIIRADLNEEKEKWVREKADLERALQALTSEQEDSETSEMSETSELS